MNPIEKMVRDLAIKKCREKGIKFGSVGKEGVGNGRSKLTIEVIAKETDIDAVFSYIFEFMKEYYNGSD